MYEMTVRTPGLTWVRVAPSVNEALAILQAATRPGCEVEIRGKRGMPVTLDDVAGVADEAADALLPLAA